MMLLGLLLAQALAAQSPSSSPVVAVAASSASISVSTETAVVVASAPAEVPAVLGAPVLLSARVAFASTEAVRIEWETDRSAVGEVRYGTAAPLALSVRATVFSPNQSATFDSSGFELGRLHYQVAWAGRDGLTGISDVKQVSEPRRSVDAPQARKRTRWLIFGGRRFREGGDVGWNWGAAFRPLALPIEAAVETSAVDASWQVYRPNAPGVAEHLKTWETSVRSIRARVGYLYRIEPSRPNREKIFGFPAFLRAGGGLASFLVHEEWAEKYASRKDLDWKTTRARARAAPFLEAGIGISLGRWLEAQASVEHVLANDRIGMVEFRYGGTQALVQLAWRVW